jgi:hypothetical protein
MVSEEKRSEEERFFTLREALLLCVFVVKKRDRNTAAGWRCAPMVSEEKRSEEESFFYSS